MVFHKLRAMSPYRLAALIFLITFNLNMKSAVASPVTIVPMDTVAESSIFAGQVIEFENK